MESLIGITLATYFAVTCDYAETVVSLRDLIKCIDKKEAIADEMHALALFYMQEEIEPTTGLLSFQLEEQEL